MDCKNAYDVISNDQFDFGSFAAVGSKTYSVALNKGDTLRTGLAFLRNASYEIKEVTSGTRTRKVVVTTLDTLPNLELELLSPSNTVVAYSRTTNNTLEIVEYTATVSGTYTVRIRSTVSTESDVWFSLAWSVD